MNGHEERRVVLYLARPLVAGFDWFRREAYALGCTREDGELLVERFLTAYEAFELYRKSHERAVWLLRRFLGCKSDESARKRLRLRAQSLCSSAIGMLRHRRDELVVLHRTDTGPRLLVSMHLLRIYDGIDEKTRLDEHCLSALTALAEARDCYSAHLI